VENSEFEILKLLFEKFSQLNYNDSQLMLQSQTANNKMQSINLRITIN